MKTDALLVLDGANTKMSIRTPQGEMQQDDILRMRKTRTCESKIALIRKPKRITNIVTKSLCSLRIYALLLQKHNLKYNQILLASFVSNTWALRRMIHAIVTFWGPFLCIGPVSPARGHNNKLLQNSLVAVGSCQIYPQASRSVQITEP